jgi:DNA-binding CsgD family transcriptional regulator
MLEDLDLLPGEVKWRDEGCELFARCLDCPLPKCVEEEPRWRQRLSTRLKDRKITELKRQGKSNEEIAGALGISSRTVRRALSRTTNVIARNAVTKQSQEKSDEIASRSLP